MATTVKQDAEITVSARVRNVLQRMARGKAWWVLAPIGPGTPWDRAVYQSTIDLRQYKPLSVASINWNAIVAVPDGLYDVALLLHAIGPDDQEVHADYVDAGPIRLHAPSTEPWLIRHAGSAGPVAVIAASGPRSISRVVSPFVRLITLVNRHSSTVTASAQLESRSLPTGSESTWWLSERLYSTVPVTVDIEGNSARTIQFDALGPSSLLATFPAAQFWVVVSVEGTTSDEVLLGGPRTFNSVPSAYTRRFAPSGPIEIGGIDDRTPFGHTARHIVAIVVDNISGSQQTGRVWWYLARPNDLAPWADAPVGGAPVQFTLGSWAGKTIDVPAYRPALTGQWELSAWVHYEKSGGQFIQADGLWLRELVNVN